MSLQSYKTNTIVSQLVRQETSHTPKTVTITVKETTTIIEGGCHEYTGLSPIAVVSAVFAIIMLMLLVRLVKRM